MNESDPTKPKPYELDETSQGVMLRGGIGMLALEPQPSGKVFEQYRRPPGSRTIVVSPEGKVLITREHRRETGGYDLRLPGGKVFDRYEDWQAYIASGEDELEAAKTGAGVELRQEAGIVIKDPELITKANAGSTVQWDLYYFLVRQYEEHAQGQQLEHGEDIEVTWLTPDEIVAAIAAGQFAEWRSVGVLLGLVLPGLKSTQEN